VLARHQPVVFRQASARLPLALRAKNDDGAPKLDLSELGDPNDDGLDLWATWKNTIYGGSIAIAVLLPVFFIVLAPK
jgi:hypothetical protein